MSLYAGGVNLRHRGGGWLLREVELRLQAGQLHALIGPNGAGKTSLLRLLAGDLASDPPVLLDGRPLQRWAPIALARRRAVFSQHDVLRFDFTAAEVVGLGRLPWRTPADADATAAALAAVGAEPLATRPYTELSGGERARVRLARALAQIWPVQALPPRFLLLDEPLAHLDFAFRQRCLQLLRNLSAAGAGVLLVLHEPELAAAWADRVTLLGCGEVVAQGPAAVLTPSVLSRAYGVPIARHNGLWHVESQC
ncbi:MAG: ATP-binding cassette domain-containing protein [Gammaproteobacteria bacterium]|nr:ATP-binding cassette domain-containing protein [Gammaproteobacteria bacterium]